MRGIATSVHEIDVLTVRGLGILGLNDSLLRAGVQANSRTVRVLLLDPDGEAARRRAAEIGEGYGSFRSGVRLSIELLRDLADETGTVQCHLYVLMPMLIWRVISLDTTIFVSAFGDKDEGHTPPMYRLVESPHGALHRGFRRFMDDLRRTARQVM